MSKTSNSIIFAQVFKIVIIVFNFLSVDLDSYQIKH